jgi:predicted RecB family endonuclease
MGGAVFSPDVIVRANDRPDVRLAIEVKAGQVDVQEAARQLRAYMSAVACPLGLLVTPRETHVYQETWSENPDSIRELAVVETPVLIGTRGISENEWELEGAVRRWLETMVRHPGVPLHRGGEVARVEDQLLPALVDAEVTVTGFR